MTSTTDLLGLRWRTAQWLLARHDGDDDQAAILRAVMRVEGINGDDVADELRLLLREYGHLGRFHVAAEVDRLGATLAGVR